MQQRGAATTKTFLLVESKISYRLINIFLTSVTQIFSREREKKTKLYTLLINNYFIKLSLLFFLFTETHFH